uniref:CH-like domain-containing protein n=1 Tax=Glossina palpalis gambiensis TaxID=67801 RepID=A0A1B0BX47_9MUSC
MPKKLTNEDLETLKLWLMDHEVHYKNLNRDASDAVLVVTLLKKIHPKLIDLHNYPSRNNTQLKINNWETLNLKVLSKLGLQQSKSMLEKLAKGTVGAVEALLSDIMLMEKANQARGDKRDDEQEQLWSENDDLMMVTVNKKIGDAIIQVPQKMILYSIYEQVLRKSQAKDVYLSASQQKITHLENVLKLKAERIEELCAQLAKVSVRSLMKQHNLETSSSNSALPTETLNDNNNNNNNNNNNSNSNINNDQSNLRTPRTITITTEVTPNDYNNNNSSYHNINNNLSSNKLF